MKIRLMNGVLSKKKKKTSIEVLLFLHRNHDMDADRTGQSELVLITLNFITQLRSFKFLFCFKLIIEPFFFFFTILSSILLTTLLSSRKISILLMHQVLEELVLQNTYSRLPILWAHKITIVNCIWHQNTRLYIIHVFKIPTQCRRMPLSWTTRESCYV